jgi:hypothetical protein
MSYRQYNNNSNQYTPKQLTSLSSNNPYLNTTNNMTYNHINQLNHHSKMP